VNETERLTKLKGLQSIQAKLLNQVGSIVQQAEQEIRELMAKK